MKHFFKQTYMVLLIVSCLLIVPTMLILDGCGMNPFKVPSDDSDDPNPSVVTSTTTTTATTTTTTTGSNTTATTPSSVDSTSSQSVNPTTTTTGTVKKLQIPDKSEVINFPDTLFIGDSRTVGLRDWVKIGGATFFCDVGLSSNNATTKAIKVPGVSNSITLPNLLAQKQFKTVYIMLGINEIGGSLSGIAGKYQKIIDLVHQKQPNAIVVVQSTLRVTAARHTKEVKKGGYFNNNRINDLNVHLQGLANGTTVRWLDMNPMFDDGTGNLAAEAAAGDGIHFQMKYYLIWRKYLDEHRLA